MYITPEQFVARLGSAELLLYSADFADTPNFANSTIKNVIRASEYSLAPKFDANSEENIIAGIPDRNMFTVDKVKLEGDIKFPLSAYISGQLDYTTSMLFEHLRCGWSGYDSLGNLISPLTSRLSGHPCFSLGSAYHGIFNQCLVNKFELSVSNGREVELTFGIVATGYSPQSAFTIQGLESISTLPDFLGTTKRFIYAWDCMLIRGAGDVIGNFAMQDASDSTFSSGMNKPAMPTLLNNFSISFENNLEPVYTMHSQSDDPVTRFSENVFPASYVMSAPRRITGQIEWFGNVDGKTFIEKLTGPGSIQGNETLKLNLGPFDIEIKYPVWSLSEKTVGMDKVKRIARFSAVTDSDLIIPYYDSQYN